MSDVELVSDHRAQSRRSAAVTDCSHSSHCVALSRLLTGLTFVAAPLRSVGRLVFVTKNLSSFYSRVYFFILSVILGVFVVHVFSFI